MWNDNHFGPSIEVDQPEDLKGYVKALVLWGGEDISPSLYGQTVGLAEAPDVPSRRDAMEVLLVKEAVRIGLPIIGVCRGAQLLCALAGGTLWQHVDHHAGRDHCIVYKGKAGLTNSFHHQMMRPPEDAEVIAYSRDVLSPMKYEEGFQAVPTDEPEPEIVFFPSLNAVGVQGHPEWLDRKHFLNVVMKDVILDKLNLEA